MTGPGWQSAPELRPATRRTPVADLFEEAFRLYRRGFLTMLAVFGAFEIPFVLLNLPVTVLQARIYRAQWEADPFLYGGLDWPDAVGRQLMASLLVILATLVLVFLLLTFAAAGVSIVASLARSGSPSPRESFTALGGAAVRLLGLILVLIVGLAGISLLIGATSLIVITLFGANIGVTIGLIALLMIALLVLVIFLGARFALGIPVLVLEGRDAIDALRHSWSLVRGSTWRVLGIIYLAILLVTVVGGVLPMVLVPGLYGGMLTGSVASYVELALVSGGINLVLGPILPTLATVLYFDLARQPGEAPS